jgi:hypothetical protein
MRSREKEALLILGLTEEWRETTFHWIEDIGGWRNHLGERIHYAGDPTRGWESDEEAERGITKLWGTTTMLMQRIATQYRHLETSDLQKIYGWIATWLRTHSARKLPDQATLQLTWEKALAVVKVLEHQALEDTDVHKVRSGPGEGDDRHGLTTPGRDRPRPIKPGGWTKTEIIREVQAAEPRPQFSEATFDRLRRAADVKERTAANERFNNAELRLLADTAESGGLLEGRRYCPRDGKAIAQVIRELLPPKNPSA